MLLPLSLQCFAQAASINDCQAIQDRLARYACYDSWDSASGTVRQSAPARSSSARVQQEEEEGSLLGRIFDGDDEGADQEQAEPAQTATVSTPESELESFGRVQPSTRLIDGLDGQSELVDTIADLEQLGPSMWLISLEGGQQWKQMLSKRYTLQEGDEIRIYPTRWGNDFRLSSTRLGGFIQVTRIDAGYAASEVASEAAPQPAPRTSAPPVQQQEEEEERSLLGRIGGIFDRDDEEAAEPEEPAQVATAATPESELESFGRVQPSTRLIDGLDGKSELVDTITTLEQVGPSLWLITLEGGQQWKQMVGKRYSLQEGEEIRIYPTRWGNAFRLTSSRLGGYIQVARFD